MTYSALTHCKPEARTLARSLTDKEREEYAAALARYYRSDEGKRYARWIWSRGGQKEPPRPNFPKAPA